MNLTPQDINELLTVLNVALVKSQLDEQSAERVRRDSHDWPFAREEVDTARAEMDIIRKWIHYFSQFVGSQDQEDATPDWRTIEAQAKIDLEAVTTDQDAYRFIETYMSKDLRGRYMAIYRSDRHEMGRSPRQALDNLLSLPPIE